ncbi:MAG: HEAT repeat domain-containing protein [Anaerolineales bacterium]|nr:HEAT repeat domain-containing protein [Anaerolineales bacterium]
MHADPAESTWGVREPLGALGFTPEEKEKTMGLFGPPNVEKMKMNRDVKGLINALGYQKDASIPRSAALALAGIDRPEAIAAFKNPQAVDWLIASLNDEKYYNRWSAARGLGRIGDVRAVEPLTAALKDEHSDVRTSAAEALGLLGDARAVKPLKTALKDKEPGVRSVAAEALGRLGDARAVKPLIALLEDSTHIKVSSGTGYRNVNEYAGDALVQIGAPAVEPLLAAYKGKDGRVNSDVIRLLGRLGDARAVETLIAELESNRLFGVRSAAAAALGRIGDPRAVEPLIAALQDRDILVRDSAAEALGQIGDPRAVNPLIAALEETSGVVRDDIAKALNKLNRTPPQPVPGKTNMDPQELKQRYSQGERNFNNADLRKADLGWTDLTEINLENADLRAANLKGSTLVRANLRGADLQGADLSRATLRGADLSEANLYMANLNDAFMIAANLLGATLPDGTKNS